MAMQGSMTISTAGESQLQQITKTLSICTMLREVTNKSAFRKHSQYSSQKFEHALPLSTLGFFSLTMLLHIDHWWSKSI
jgi:hypothetical protein